MCLFADEEESIQAKLSKYLGEDDSSGSDFEEELKKTTRVSSEDEELEKDESGDEDEDELVVKEKEKKAPLRWKKGKSVANKKVENGKSSLHDMSISSKLSVIKKEISLEKKASQRSSKESSFKMGQFKSKIDPSSLLNLSESSDSEPDSSEKKVTCLKIHLFVIPKLN